MIVDWRNNNSVQDKASDCVPTSNFVNQET